MARARTAGEHPGRRDKSLTVPVPRENTYLPRAGITASGSRSMTVSRTRAARSGTRRPCSHSIHSSVCCLRAALRRQAWRRARATGKGLSEVVEGAHTPQARSIIRAMSCRELAAIMVLWLAEA